MVVQAEVFHLWVIEAPKKIAEEFPADKAGLNVIFVPSEEPYHQRKVTLLNGPHTVLAPVAFLSGIDIVRDACQDELIGKYIRQVMYKELLPTLDLPQNELKAFADSVIDRFENPFVDHSVTSIMLNSFSKFETRDLPGLKIYFEKNKELPKGIVAGLAAIITYYKGGVRNDGKEYSPQDSKEVTELLNELWKSDSTEHIAQGVLSENSIWGGDLSLIPGLKDLLVYYLDIIKQKGMRSLVEEIIK